MMRMTTGIKFLTMSCDGGCGLLRRWSVYFIFSGFIGVVRISRRSTKYTKTRSIYSCINFLFLRVTGEVFLRRRCLEIRKGVS